MNGQLAGYRGASRRVSRLTVAVQQLDGTVEQRLARIASRSHGVVTRAELLAAGVTAEGIRQRLKRGTIFRVHRGVYRVGHRAPSREARYLAAVKACGEGALLAGRASAHLWGLLKGAAPPPEVIALTERHIPGVVVHRARRTVAEATERLGIPVTTVPRTLVDLASSLPESALARACHEAQVLYATTPEQVEAVLARRPSSPGARTLRRILHGGIPVTLSRLESRFLERLRQARLPLPQTNPAAGGYRVDCRWPEGRLTVELDGYRYHHSRHAWEQDRRREREARARGDEFRRYTYGDVFETPALMLAELRALLSPMELAAY
jgi:very-short-patch-repair endonuclease/predicted transcriptional regulator of viral defense system